MFSTEECIVLLLFIPSLIVAGGRGFLHWDEESILEDLQEKMRSGGKIHSGNKIKEVPQCPISILLTVEKSEPERVNVQRFCAGLKLRSVEHLADLVCVPAAIHSLPLYLGSCWSLGVGSAGPVAMRLLGPCGYGERT